MAKTIGVKEWMEALGCSRRTVYNRKWIWDRVFYEGDRPRWHESDVALYLATRPTGRRRREPRAA